MQLQFSECVSFILMYRNLNFRHQLTKKKELNSREGYNIITLKSCTVGSSNMLHSNDFIGSIK